jgi:hypothetical protein
MPSELTGFELSKLDLLDRKSRSLPPCFHEVTVAPKRLLLAVLEWKGSVHGLLTPGLEVKEQILTRSLRWIPTHQQLTISRYADPKLCKRFYNQSETRTHRLGSQSDDLSVVLDGHFDLIWCSVDE